ncbi:hypothetical protein [Bacillus phage SDFMU_Pbc]|uniref:Repressor Rok winged helix domain-containing protein n=1 Tax=Bacillus phage SDFMU_Pbc TaxID=3076135 RepID=A0AA96R2L6_9CAUD|nr:hypothetical protein [Bacillus phage SDFMU_Pbc]
MEKMYTEREANRMYAEYLKQQVVYHQSRIEMVQEELKGVVEKIEKLDSISIPLINENKIETEDDDIAAVVRAYDQKHSPKLTDNDEKEDDIPLPFAETFPRRSANKGKRRGKYRTSRSGSDRRDVKKVAKLVVHILKEAKEPISLNKLKEELEKRKVPTHSMYALLQQVKAYEPGITKANWGYYRYKGE